MINTRVMKIIRILLSKDTYFTIDTISNELNVSNKTIRNDLQLVDEWLKENNVSLIKKTGVGIHIKGSQLEKLKLMEILKQKNNVLIDYSPEARKLFICMQILMSENNCRIYELSNELFVSRATIHKDIIALTPLLEKNKITLTRKNNNGISVQAKERNKRNLLLELMIHDNGYQIFMNMVQHDNYVCDGSMVFAGLDLSDDEVKEFLNLILHKHPYLDSLVFQSMIQILLHLYVIVLRVQSKQYVHLSDQFLDELKKEPYFDEAKQLLDLMAEHYKLTIPETEIHYLQIYMISLKGSNQANIHDEIEARDLTNQIIASWCEQLNLPFHEDVNLPAILYNHLCPAITRFRHGIPIENPLKQEIRKLYRNTYEITKISLKCVEDFYHCQLSEDEIDYFTLHLATALEHMKQPLKTIIVCHSGIGAGNLLVSKLSKQIPEIQIVSCETFISIHHYDLHDIDLIISTMDFVLEESIPILKIGSLLYEHDIIRLKDIINEYFKIKNDPLQAIEKSKV